MPMYGILLPCLWPGAPSLLLLIVRQATKTNMQDCWSFAALQTASLEPLAHRRNVASFLKSFVCIGITLQMFFRNWFNWFHFLFLDVGLHLTLYSLF